VKLAAENDADRPAKTIGQFDLGSGEAQERQALLLFRQELDGIVADNVWRTAARQQSHETQREFLFRRMEMREKDAAVDLLDVHRTVLAALYHDGLPVTGREKGLDRKSIEGYIDFRARRL
jgi:hypothetical protein